MYNAVIRMKEFKMPAIFNINPLVAVICMSILANTCYAFEHTNEFAFPASNFYTQDTKSFVLASNSADLTPGKGKASKLSPASEFAPPFISASKAHQYLGIGTIAFAALTAMTHPSVCDGNGCPARDVNGTHATFARTTLAMAAATIATGFYAHWHDISLEEGISDPDSLHVLLAGTGALLLAYAANLSANSSTPVNHAGIAEAGVLSMIIAVKLTW